MSQYKVFACMWWHIVVNNFSEINVLHIFCTAASASNTLSHSSMYSWMSLYFSLEAWDNIGLEKTISKFSTVLYTHIQHQCYLQQLETRWQDVLSMHNSDSKRGKLNAYCFQLYTILLSAKLWYKYPAVEQQNLAHSRNSKKYHEKLKIRVYTIQFHIYNTVLKINKIPYSSQLATVQANTSTEGGTLKSPLDTVCCHSDSTMHSKCHHIGVTFHFL